MPLLHSRRAHLRVRSRALLAPFVLCAAVLAACGDSSAFGGAETAAGLATVFDSTTPDTVVARTSGAVSARAVRTAVEELRIAPEADDTSLFADVSEFDVGADGRLFVFDRPSNVLLVFDSSGTRLHRVGRQGAGPGEFNANSGMVVLRDGRLALWDSRNARISFFSPEGEFLTSWVVPAGFSTSNGLRSDTSGAVYLYRPVTAPRGGEILGRFGLVRLQDGGAFGDSLVPPDLPVERVTYIARREGSTSATSPTHAPRFMWEWHPDGHFVSVASSTFRVEVSRPGRALRIVRDAAAVPVPDDERAWDQERITISLRGVDPGWVWRGPPIPAEKPPVAGLSVARDGRIWVRVATPSEPIPEDARDVQRPDRPPPARYRDAVVYEVFARDGRFLGRVGLPLGSQWMQADGDRVWLLQRDELGLPAVTRLRIEPAF
jgi:hypothetical protein